MAEIIISFPKRLKKKMGRHSEIDWAEVFRKTTIGLLHRLELVDFLETKLENDEFTEEDVLKLGKLAKEKRLKQLKSDGLL